MGKDSVDSKALSSLKEIQEIKAASEVSKSEVTNISNETFPAEQEFSISSVNEQPLEENKNESANIEQIRTQQQILLDKKKQKKLDVALDYTKKKFALHTTDEDLLKLCDAIRNYIEQRDVPEEPMVKVEGLSNLDLYHFGWNIWNYFRVTNQDAIAKFLRTVFVALKDVEQGSIKSHLRDDENKGIVKIEPSIE